jgi:lysozyme
MIRTYDPLAGVSSAQGLDVSNWTGAYSWSAAVKDFPGLAFGIFRLTQGLGSPGTVSPDPDAAWNHAQIRDNGLRRGAYHFLDPRLDGAAQARYFVDVHGQLGFAQTDLLFLDNETPGASPQAVAACAEAFMAELVTLRPGNPHGVYTYISFANEGNCAGLEHYPLWLAYPAASAPKPPPPWVAWTFWQWGLRNGVDADAFNGTIADLDTWIASFAPPTGPPYRHLTQAGDTIAALAASRNASVENFISRSALDYTPADETAMAMAKLPAGIPWYSDNP